MLRVLSLLSSDTDSFNQSDVHMQYNPWFVKKRSVPTSRRTLIRYPDLSQQQYERKSVPIQRGFGSRSLVIALVFAGSLILGSVASGLFFGGTPSSSSQQKNFTEERARDKSLDTGKKYQDEI